VTGQAALGARLGGVPILTNLEVSPRADDDLSGLLSPHQTGRVWASARWDATWVTMFRYGASHDLLTGFGGENRMLRIGIEATIGHSCPVSFVSARNEVLSRDLTAAFDLPPDCADQIFASGLQ
jgi:hypothetical protein